VTGSRRAAVAGVLACATVLFVLAGTQPSAEGPALRLHATGVGTSLARLTIELNRWSTDAERAPLHAALAAPPPPPAGPPAAASGRGRGGRGGAPPPSPDARLTAAVKAAPTCGYIWGEGATGFSIKYAWRSSSPGGTERVVLVTERRIATPTQPSASDAPGEQEFTVVEMRIDPNGNGEGKTSLTTKVVMDTSANTLALDAYASAPIQLKVTR
jgi:hypothetical protein